MANSEQLEYLQDSTDNWNRVCELLLRARDAFISGQACVRTYVTFVSFPGHFSLPFPYWKRSQAKPSVVTTLFSAYKNFSRKSAWSFAYILAFSSIQCNVLE